MAVIKAASLPSVSFLGMIPAQGVGKQVFQSNSNPVVLVPLQEQVGVAYVDNQDRGPGQLQSFTDTAAVALASLGQLVTGLLIIAVAWLGVRSMIFHPATVKPTETRPFQKESAELSVTPEREFEPIY